MSFSFQNQGFNTFLCYEIDAGKEIDSVTVSMLTNNKIQGFAQTTFLQVDEKRYIKYNVTSKVSLKQYFSGIINKDRLLGVFSGITKAFLLADEYMIDVRSILLNLDYIFVNVSTSEVSLICLPVAEDLDNTNNKEFFKNIILNSQFDQTENGDYFAKLLNYFNSIDEINFDDFNNLLISLNGNAGYINMTAHQIPSYPVDNVAQGFTNNSPITPVNNTPSGSNGVISGGTSPTVAPQEPSVSTPIIPPVIPDKPADSSVIIGNINSSTTQNDITPSVPPIISSNSEKKEKKSGGMFSFLHKEKKEKPQKADKKEEKKTPKNNEPDSYNNIAIPGQIVPPTVKGVIPNEVPTKKESSPKPPVVPKPTVPPVAPVAPKPVIQPSVAPVAPTPAPPVVPVAPATVTSAPVVNIVTNIPNAVNFGETTVLGGVVGETTVLSPDMNNTAPVPHLIRVKNHERININKPNFRIGKEKSYVDYFIGDNTAISRSHANILSKEGKYFIVDTNSTNHTFVNGQMIPSNAELEIVHGTKIRLANEDFEFNLY